jgi:NADPH:quinone reductase-like Zn-dependent oxidoreductase
MKAVVQNNYGSADSLSIKDVEKPVIKANEILVQVYSTSINAGDYFTLKGDPWLTRLSAGFPKPKDYILGWDAAGKIAEVGSEVTLFKPGDEVYGCCEKTFAEYAAGDSNSFTRIPENITFEQAGVLPTAATTALQGLRDLGKLQKGQQVLINGASGGVGLFSVQIANALGAEVTGICSTRNIDLVRSSGADHVIDYTKEDFAAQKVKYDLILDNIASRSFASLKRVLRPDGIIVPNSGHGGMGYVFKAFLLKPLKKYIGKMYLANVNTGDLNFLNKLLKDGKLKPIIDRTFKMENISEAFNYLDKNHAQGKVAITIKKIQRSEGVQK